MTSALATRGTGTAKRREGKLSRKHVRQNKLQSSRAATATAYADRRHADFGGGPSGANAHQVATTGRGEIFRPPCAAAQNNQGSAAAETTGG